jgi:lipopolysaccharide biosynthesis glycosyltransferase
MNRVFIGYDSREDIAYRVLRYSIEQHASRPLDIRPLKIAELDVRRQDPLASTEFTYTRFLVPSLCDYQGLAIFMDCDMVALTDLNQLFDLDMSNFALRVVKHDYRPTSTVKMDGKVQTVYPRKNWSSFMLMNCAKLKLWTREAVETRPPSWLHRFEGIPDENIGDLPFTWNVLDRYDADTQLIHYTEGGPWFERYKDHPYGDVWLKYYYAYLESRGPAACDDALPFLPAPRGASLK